MFRRLEVPLVALFAFALLCSGALSQDITQPRPSPSNVVPEPFALFSDAGVDYEVVLHLAVRADGTVGAASVPNPRSEGPLEERSIEALMSWRFEPARRLGKPISSETTVRIRFSVKDTVSGIPGEAMQLSELFGAVQDSAGWSVLSPIRIPEYGRAELDSAEEIPLAALDSIIVAAILTALPEDPRYCLLGHRHEPLDATILDRVNSARPEIRGPSDCSESAEGTLGIRIMRPRFFQGGLVRVDLLWRVSDPRPECEGRILCGSGRSGGWRCYAFREGQPGKASCLMEPIRRWFS